LEEEKNKALVRRFIEEVYNRGNLDTADELLAPDFVDHGLTASEVANIEAYKLLPPTSISLSRSS
jgi:predicted SnoaL-like aldol condensation-catalyzing enzyme